jgi:hypothetical protein
MLHLDAVELHELPEASELLLSDPVRLEREARRGKIPSARVGGALGLPAPWVRAAAGIDPVDEPSTREFWLARLAPPPRTSHRTRRARSDLPAGSLLDGAEAGRRLLADEPRLARWDGDGTLPALLVDGEVRYDEVLVEALAAGTDDPARRAEVLRWARFEYVSRLDDEPSAAARAEPSPAAFAIPADLLQGTPLPDGPAGAPTPPARRLLRSEGFESIDED